MLTKTSSPEVRTPSLRYKMAAFAVAYGIMFSALGNDTKESINPHLGRADDHHLNQQAEATATMVNDVLERFPPQVPEPLERRMALTLLDLLAHDRYAPERPAVVDFIDTRLKRAVDEIEQTKITEGARIWKLYNHSFVVRTPSVTLAFDIVRSYGLHETLLDAAVVERLVAQCDVLFVSHFHADHADKEVARLFIEQGKPVVVPPRLWQSMPVTCLERKPHELQTLALKDPARELKVAVYPGHQSEKTLLNNVVLVFSPEGTSFAHTGDQYMIFDDFDWIDKVAEHHRVDVLMPNCWTCNLPRMVDGFKPKLVVTGHENELGHPISQREPYWRSYDKLPKCSAPGLVMTWGESFHYLP